MINFDSKVCGFAHYLWNTKVKCLKSLQVGGLSFLLFQNQRFRPKLCGRNRTTSTPPLLISQMPCGWGFVPSTSFDLHCHIDKSKPTLYLLQRARVCYRLNSGYGLKSFPGAEYSTLSFANTWKHSASEFL